MLTSVMWLQVLFPFSCGIEFSSSSTKAALRLSPSVFDQKLWRGARISRQVRLTPPYFYQAHSYEFHWGRAWGLCEAQLVLPQIIFKFIKTWTCWDTWFVWVLRCRALMRMVRETPRSRCRLRRFGFHHWPLVGHLLGFLINRSLLAFPFNDERLTFPSRL